MEVRVSSLSDVVLLVVEGDVDHANAAAFQEELRAALALDRRRLLIDVSHCRYIESGGLAALLTSLHDIGRDGWLGVIGPNRNLLRMFDIAGLTLEPNFLTFDTADDARHFVLRGSSVRRAGHQPSG